MKKPVNAEGRELAPQAYQKVFEALKIAQMQIKYDYNTRIQQETERKANAAILKVIASALLAAEGTNFKNE